MIVNIADHGGSIVWEGIYYFALSDFPNISDWELRNLLLFIDYEKKYNRETEIICENKNILEAVNHALLNPTKFLSASKPSIIKVPVCKNCKKGGCLTDYLCHTTEITNVKPIFSSGKLLSAIKARNKTGKELAQESRNASKDTADYFDYIMFTWGNCFVGDSLVMERTVKRAPTEDDLSSKFKPGARFYFKYDDIVNHNKYENDGHHPAKIKDELSLSDYLHCCIIPKEYMATFKDIIPINLSERVFFIENDCNDIWEWSEKVYDFVCKQKNGVKK